MNALLVKVLYQATASYALVKVVPGRDFYGNELVQDRGILLDQDSFHWLDMVIMLCLALVIVIAIIRYCLSTRDGMFLAVK